MVIANFQNLFAGYDNGDILKNINLTIGAGEHTAILGANGSGKSTLIKLFSNDLYPRPYDNSKKLLFGQERWNVADLKKYLGIITNDLHYYFQKEGWYVLGYEAVLSGFYGSLGIYRHQKYSDADRKRVEKIFSYLNIHHLREKKIEGMSTGEIRKIIIARALVHGPKALLLDEPTVGLDFKAQIDFIDTIRELSKDLTIILITHHIEEVFPEIKKVLLLKNGEILKQGGREEVITTDKLSEAFDVSLRVKECNGYLSFDRI